MKVAAICLLWFSVINLRGGESVSYTNGFPTRLVYSISSTTGPSTRLIPDMNFTCNGVIVGYRVAGVQGNPVIQVWRKNGSLYYKTAGIVIDGDLCIGGLEMCTDLQDDKVLCCDLNQTTTNVSVQSGDILGLKLPRNSGLAFAASSRAPTNYIFRADSTSPLALSSNKQNIILPQISLQIESESHSKNCISGFPDIPISEVSHRTSGSVVTTRLFPDMNFTCNASIVGFIVAGQNFYRSPYSTLQIWRNDHAQNTGYFNVHNISMNLANGNPVCRASWAVLGVLSWCILHSNMQFSVQPGDIIGLELPATTSDREIFFTRGGPVTYVLDGQLNSTSTVNLSNNRSYSESVQQLPQIIFNLTADHCLSEFPREIDLDIHGSGRGERTVTTRLFPDMKFGCSGTIVGVTAVIRNSNRSQRPKVQIWRENETRSTLYHKIIHSGIEIRNSDHQCYRRNLNNGIFQCTLKEDLRILVQPGDFLGLEIPSIDDDDLEIYFKAGGPTNLVFQGQLESTVDLFTEPHATTNDEPYITFLVVLDEGRNSCPTADISTTAGLTTTLTTTDLTTIFTTKIDTVSDSAVPTVTKEPTSVGSSASTSGTVIGVMGGVIAILLLVGIALLVAVLVQRRHRKQYTIESNSRNYPNPVYDGTSYNRGLLTKELETSYKDDTQTNYDHIKFNVKRNEAASLHAHEDQNCNATYETLETQHYEMTGPTLATHEEAYAYWEPANTVNDLHKQLSSNKCRELLRQQVKITKALGSGQFGVVSMGVWQSPMGAMEVAVKQLQPGVTEAEKIRFLQEAAINGQFRHPNVVQLMGVVTTGEPAMIVLELLSNGDLRNFLIKHQTSQKHESGDSEMDKQLLLRFCQHIASGMSYLASKAFVHRDLAARNILVSKDNICKISDFGMSRDLLDEDYYVSRGGMVPVKWTAPEAIHYKKYSTASDVWSFGCTMYEIWSLGHKPFESYNNAEVIKVIDKGYRLPPPPGLTKELYKIMIQCWHLERFCRPTFPQLVELLSRADFELFLWEEEDLRGSSDPRVREIGAPLEIATGLYPDLQKTYLAKK